MEEITPEEAVSRTDYNRLLRDYKIALERERTAYKSVGRLQALVDAYAALVQELTRSSK